MTLRRHKIIKLSHYYLNPFVSRLRLLIGI